MWLMYLLPLVLQLIGAVLMIATCTGGLAVDCFLPAGFLPKASSKKNVMLHPWARLRICSEAEIFKALEPGTYVEVDSTCASTHPECISHRSRR